MSVSCLLCNRQLKNKASLAAHKSRYHRNTRAEMSSENHPEFQTDTVNEHGLGDRKDELQTEETPTYSSTCTSRMKDLVANVDRLYIPKRRSKKGKHRTEPFPRQRNAKTITSFSENASLLTSGSLKSDLKNITSKSSQSLCLLTSYGIRNLLFKKMDDDVVPGNLTEKQQLLVKAALSLTSLNELAKLLNENIDTVLQIIIYANTIDTLS